MARVTLVAFVVAAFCRIASAEPGISSLMLPPAPVLPQTYVGVVVLTTFSDTESDDTRASTTQSIVDEVSEFDGFRAVSPARLRDELSRAGLPKVHCDDMSCQARVSRYAGAHYALASELRRELLVLWLYDTDNGRLLGTAERALPSDAFDRAHTVRSLVVQLLSPQTFVGALDVETEGSGVGVYIDDQWMGETPLAKPVHGLTVGLHRVQLVAPGALPVHHLVEIGFAKLSRVRLARGDTAMQVSTAELDEGVDAGIINLAELPLGVEVRVDGALRAVTSLLTERLMVRLGRRKLTFRKAGLESGTLRFDVRSGLVHVVGLRVVDGKLRPELRRVISPRRARLEVLTVDPLSALLLRTNNYATRQLTFNLPVVGTLSGMRAARVAATGFLTREIRRLSTPVFKPPELRTAYLQRTRAGLLMPETIGSTSFAFESWHWVTLGGMAALIATGTSLLMYDTLNGGSTPRFLQAQRFDIPGLTGFRVMFRDDYARITLRGQW